MRLVYVVPFVPYPPRDGASIRIWNTLRELGPRHDIDLVIQSDALPDNANMAPLQSLVSSICFIPHRPRARGAEGRRAAMLDALQYPPAFLTRFRSQSLVQHISALIAARGGVDWLICDTQLSGQVALSARLSDVRKALCLYDVYDTAAARKVAATPPGPYKVKFMLDRLKVRQYERRIMRAFDLLSVVSADDQRLVAAQVSSVPIVLAPNGVDLDYYRPGEWWSGTAARSAGGTTEAIDSNDTAGVVAPLELLFVGNLAYEPNEDGVRYFLTQIWPLLRRQVPNVRFVAAGVHPPAWLLAMAERDDTLTVTGMVEDVRPLYHRARAIVVPLRLGAGTKLKVLEALAMGVPIVSTPQGCAGLHVRDGQHLLIGATPDHFAARVVEVLQDGHLARHLATEGRQLVEREYGWPAIMATFERALCEGVSTSTPHDHFSAAATPQRNTSRH